MSEAEVQTKQDIGPRVFRVAVENIMPLWPQLDPLIVSGLRTVATHDAEDVRRMLLGQACHLWIQWSDRVEAMVISEFTTYPKGLWLRLWLGAALPDAKMRPELFMSELEDWRVTNGCVEFEIIGRTGWGRLLPGARYEAVVWRGLP